MSLSEIGVERWQYDLWHQIILAALEGHPDQVDLSYHPNLDSPAASRYGATTPGLLAWFRNHNENKPYCDQVRPNNFLLAYQINSVAISDHPDLLQTIAGENSWSSKPVKLPKPIAPFDRNSGSAAEKCFDRDTGIAVPRGVLKTYKGALAQYHLRPERKFDNGNYTDCGVTQRRHVKPIAIRNIGKESNRWEGNFYLGSEEDAEIDYGLAPKDLNVSLDKLRAQIVSIGQRQMSRRSGISRRTISRFLERRSVRKDIVERLNTALQKSKRP